MALQKFFNYNSVKEDWTTSKNSKLKPNKWCLLRLGMEDSEECVYNSFLSCIKNVTDYKDKLIEGTADDRDGQKFSISSKLTLSDEEFRYNIQDNFGFDDDLNRDYEKYVPSDEHMNKFISLNKGNLYNMFSDSEGGGKEESI